jgi:hypothetical protein
MRTVWWDGLFQQTARDKIATNTKWDVIQYFVVGEFI